MGKTNVFAVWEKNLQLDGNVARDCLLLGILDEDRFGTTQRNQVCASGKDHRVCLHLRIPASAQVFSVCFLQYFPFLLLMVCLRFVLASRWKGVWVVVCHIFELMGVPCDPGGSSPPS